MKEMEKKQEEIPKKDQPLLICFLCASHIALHEYERHMAIHEQAELLADILALSRR